MKVQLTMVFVAFTLDNEVDGIHCYECRSNRMLSCGDPFLASDHISLRDCNEISIRPSIICYKSKTNVGGVYFVTRGCAPFDSEFISLDTQKGIVGTYWRRSSSLFSFCDQDACNQSSKTIDLPTRILILLLTLPILVLS